MRRGGNRFLKFLLYFFFPITVFAIFLISFLAFKKLVFPNDHKLRNGMTVSSVASNIRNDLLKRKDLQSVLFSSKDGIRISGYFISRQSAIGNIVLAHGYQGCKEFVSEIIDFFPDYNFLLFDFRAHGLSEGRFRTLGCHEYKDLFAAVDFLRDKTKPKRMFSKVLPMFVFGISMGGAVALDAVKRRPELCDALIVDSSFANLNDVVYRALKIKAGLPAYPFAPILMKMVNFVANCKMEAVSIIDGIEKVKQPILFVHSCKDNVVDPKDSVNMYSLVSNEQSKIWIAPKTVHAKTFRYFPELYKKKIGKFLKKVS